MLQAGLSGQALFLARLAGGVGGTNPGGWKDLLGFGPGEGAPPYSVPYLPGVGTLGRDGLSEGGEEGELGMLSCSSCLGGGGGPGLCAGSMLLLLLLASVLMNLGWYRVGWDGFGSDLISGLLRVVDLTSSFLFSLFAILFLVPSVSSIVPTNFYSPIFPT